MNKNILIGIGLILVLAALAYFPLSRTKEAAQETPAQTPAASLQESSTSTPGPASPSLPSPKPVVRPVVKEFYIVAKQFVFEPGIIVVDKGDRVRLHVSSSDVTHGISIPDFGVNATIKIGIPQTVEFVASKTGTYGIFCSEYCGAGHPNMKGTLIVK